SARDEFADLAHEREEVRRLRMRCEGRVVAVALDDDERVGRDGRAAELVPLAAFLVRTHLAREIGEDRLELRRLPRLDGYRRDHVHHGVLRFSDATGDAGRNGARAPAQAWPRDPRAKRARGYRREWGPAFGF